MPSQKEQLILNLEAELDRIGTLEWGIVGVDEIRRCFRILIEIIKL